MLIRLCSKSFKLGFNNMWTENFQMYRLSLEKAEEQEIKLATPAGSQIKARKFPKNVLHWLLESLCEDHNKLWKILQEMGIPDHLRNLYAGQEATVRTLHGTTDWFKTGKGVHQGCILSPCLFNFYADYIMWNARLDESQAGIKIARGISIASGMQMTPHSWQKVKRN